MYARLVDAGLGISFSLLIVKVARSDWDTSFWVAWVCVLVLILVFGFSDHGLKR